MISRALSSFLNSVIREHIASTGCSKYISVDDLSFIDKKIIMSHIDINEYEYFINNPTGMMELLDEYKDYIQQLLNDELNSVEVENMEELGLRSYISPINGETLWSKAS